jgi:hypothetical protein
MHRTIELCRRLDYLFDFEVKDIKYNSGRCTVETGVLENMGVAVVILRVSLLEPEIRRCWYRLDNVLFHTNDCGRRPQSRDPQLYGRVTKALTGRSLTLPI